MATLWTPLKPGARESLTRWVERRIPGLEMDVYSTLPVAVLFGDYIAAVAVYHDRRAHSVEMSIAADTPLWATRGVIAELLSYPFEIFGVRRITAIVRADNVRALRLDEGLGFVREGVMRQAFADCDAIILGMTREDAQRWNRYRRSRPLERAA